MSFLIKKIYKFGIHIYIYICYSEEKNNGKFRKIFRHFVFINYIILYNKTFAKMHYKFYNNYKCHHRNEINNLHIRKNIDLPIKL